MNRELLSLAVALGFAAVAGLIGAFALLKRMVLASDVISHVALPGIALALLIHVNPLLGAAATMLVGVIAIWNLEARAGLAADAAIGVVFTTSLALGTLIMPGEELVDVLLGRSDSLSGAALLFGGVAVAALFLLVFVLRHQLTLRIFSPDLAAAAGVKVSRLDFVFLLAFTATVFLGLRFLGALLAGALLMLPAAVARRMSGSMKAFLLLSSAVSCISLAGGALLSRSSHLPLGPLVGLCGGALFLLTLLPGVAHRTAIAHASTR